MRRRGSLVTIAIVAAVLPAAMAPDSLGRSGKAVDVTTLMIPGPAVNASPALLVGHRYKMTLRGTGKSRQGGEPDFDWFYCFGATCSTPGGRILLVYFCQQEPSNFGTVGVPVPYQSSHTYELTVERTFDSPGPSPGLTLPGSFIFRNAAGDKIGGCGVGESEPGTLNIDPFSAYTVLDYIEGGRTKRGDGGTFQIELTDVGSISRPPTTTGPSSTPQAPATSSPAAGLNVAVVGHRYSVGASGKKSIASGPKFTSSVGTYVVRSVHIRLSAGFTYTSVRLGSSVKGTAVATLVLAKLNGTGPASASVPLTYSIVTAGKATPDKAAREWFFSAKLVKPAVRGCETGRFVAGKLARAYVSFNACGVNVFIRPAAVTIT